MHEYPENVKGLRTGETASDDVNAVTLLFESNFEGGNLGRAVQVRDIHANVNALLRCDPLFRISVCVRQCEESFPFTAVCCESLWLRDFSILFGVALRTRVSTTRLELTLGVRKTPNRFSLCAHAYIFKASQFWSCRLRRLSMTCTSCPTQTSRTPSTVAAIPSGTTLQSQICAPGWSTHSTL